MLLLLSLAHADSPPLAPDARGAAAPDRAFDMERLRLDLALDPDAGAVSGTATWSVRRLGEGPLVLDQVALDITEVKVGNAAVPWHLAQDTLVIEVPGHHAEVAIRYRATPRNGLHFRKAEDGYPEVWSQGEATDNRYWFPGWDHPNDRFVYDGNITAPAGWKVLTNTGHDMVNYLVMVAAGPYEVHGGAANAVWVPPGTPDAGVRRVLDPIPGMMAHFAGRTGVPYPWVLYRQVFVQRFLYTGMENTSATVEARELVAGPAVEGTRRRRVQSVVAHELAHQWYGDLLTCRNWRELWLNEGFATFFAADWQASVEGPDDWAAGVFGRYRASVAKESLAHRFYTGKAPDNANPYNKGASVLQMLRVLLGEDVFWAGMRRYTQGHAWSLVETDDLADAMEAASGQELGWFFQQWVELPYVPELTVTSEYASGELRVTVAQDTGNERPLYTIPVEVEVGTAKGPVTRRTWLTEGHTELSFALSEAPTYVAFDPRGGVLAKVTQDQEPAAWEAQVSSPSPYARIVAIDALGGTNTTGALVRVATASSHALRLAAIRALGEQRATKELLPLLGDPDDEVRARVADALGNGVGTAAMDALAARVANDPNPDVQAAALEAMGRLDGDRSTKLAIPRLKATALEQDQLLAAAAHVIGEHGTAKELPALLAVRGPGRARLNALRAAARLVAREDPGKARDRLQAQVARAAEELLEDRDRRGREGAVALLGQLGDEATVSRLEQFRRVETIVELREAAANAIKDIRAHARPDTTPNEMEARIEALERKLQEIEEAGEEKH